MPSYEMIQVEGVIFSITPQVGALVVYCPRKYKGVNIHVSINRDRKNKVAVQVMARQVNGRKRYVAVFPALPVGTHAIESRYEIPRAFSIFPGSVSEVEFK
jgi:hypothetical protein